MPKAIKKNLSAWGNYPKIQSTVYYPKCSEDLRNLLLHKNIIAQGNARSYGDSALSENVISTSYFRYLKSFDAATGVLTCETGVLLADIIHVFFSQGWFLPVTPGTKFVSIGGAIASDIHGKNHHHSGCFSDYILSINLMLPNGEIIRCSRFENPSLFYATCGGMGLTGIILEARIQLIRVPTGGIKQQVIKTRNIDEICALFDTYDKTTYSVAWIDCLARKNKLGRSLLMLGEHTEEHSSSVRREKQKKLPINILSFLFNKKAIRLFNTYHYHFTRCTEDVVNFDTFFYPLDHIQDWNKLYGTPGFVQYQFVLPDKSANEGMRLILKEIANNQEASPLAVLKKFGDANNNYLSFPLKGLTLALDFKLNKNTLHFLDRLDSIVCDFGGRVYLTKDARVSKGNFLKMYHQLDRFAEIRNSIGATQIFNSSQSRRLGI